ncbi:MAG: hypothetical protein GC171_02565 [Terrimonas sp.]|nr:hypothetical protein [Terrimonas sp.]
MRVFIPENIEIEELLKKTPPKNNGKPKKDYLAYVMGVVSEEIFKRRNRLEVDEYVPIYSKLLKELIGSNYNKYLDYLRRTKILKRNKQYTEGKSRGYYFNKPYLKGFKPYTIKDRKLRLKLKTYFEKEERAAVRKLPYLHKWIKSGKLSIEKDLAQSVLPLKYNEKINAPKSSKSKMSKEEIANISMYCWQRSIDSFYNGIYVNRFTVDDGGGRLHTALTNISRSFRKYLKYDNQTLVHVDIANSQPYFAAVLLNPSFWESSMLNSRQRQRIRQKLNKRKKHPQPQNEPKAKKEGFEISPKLKSDIKYNKYYSLLMVLKSDESESQREFERYKKYVSSGQFYQKVADEFNNAVKPRKDAMREDVKKWMFEVFFSKNPPFLVESLERPQSKLFRQLFPAVSQIFKIIKKDKHNTLALLLQNLESQALLHCICRLIARKHPKIPLFTIHDSVVTTVGNEGIVKEIMHQELERLTGLPPTLRIKIWDEHYDE